MVACNSDSGYNKKNSEWKWKYYHGGNLKFQYREIDSINHVSFLILAENYGKDEKHVFYKHSLIHEADPETFKIIDREYSKDENHVFFDDKIVVFANPKSFQILEFPYSKDDSHVFCGTLPINLEKSEVEEFKVTNTDKLMSNMKSSILLSHFVEFNPEYKWLDTLNINGVIIGEWATGETNNKKFKGFKELNE
jgi:hypothetical protein